ncbi:uncharacterized protein LOC106653520 isoform X4 [Trichogramma pretiosum]|uniref:uncharacterized protein LOC106653520 isoform X4 n=1 Tax=Trichogramma pretiosum TaxID=7493 RepID=UPI000C71913A|nr:uncharacterized protein LOC106653520 isoform X4 [Trichogramma pretiosum]
MPQNINKKRPPSFDRYVYRRKIVPRGSQMTASNLRHWLSRGELDKLENVVLEGRGTRLLGESSPDLRTRVFLKGLPSYLTKISQIHDAVVRGSLSEVQRLVDGEPKKKLVIAKDSAGTPLIHKAVYYDHQNVLEWIIENYPATVEQRDREGRTALHYCAACRDSEVVWDLLVDAGCDSSICDRRNNPAAYYLQHGSEIELPDPERMPSKRLRFKDNSKWAGTLDIKPSNIRIWIHNRDIGKLQHVLWEGHGAKLRCETSNNVRVRRFLEAVPFIQGTIKDLHAAVIKNDIDGFRKKLDEPVSPIILCAKDTNGLNVLHKAAGLGYLELAKEILDRYPSIVNAQDVDGRTPLHYAAVCRDGGVMYDLLVEYGADENKIDNKHKTAGSYKNRPADLDMSNLVMVPEAPRSSGTGPKNFDWRLIEQTHIQLPSGRLKHSTSHNNNTEEDSAFGSAESAKITDELITPEIETPDDDKENSNLEESEEGVKNKTHVEEEEEEKEEEEVADTDPASDNNNNETESNENNENAEPATDNLEEEKSPDENEFNEATEEGEEVAEAVGSEEVEDQDEELVIGEEEALAVEEEQTGDIKDKDVEDEGQTTENEAENNDEGSAEEEAAKEEAAEEGAGEEGAAEEGTAEEGTAEEETTEKNEESNAEQSVNEGNEENEQVDIQVNKNNDEEEITHQNGEEEEINSQGEEQAIASQDEAVEINSENVSNEPVSVIDNDGEHSSPPDENVDQVENSDANVPEGDNQTAKADEKPAENEEQKETEEEATDSGVANTPNNEEQSAVEEKQEEEDNQREETAETEDAADEETEELLENGTMEQLAAIVLTGEGHRLIGRQSSNPELQAFIDNVPAYMAKIAAVHKASREGNLKDLQISLDRRKFAIAKDPSSPHGATPLHVAVIFGHTPIVRYLAGRFPETAHALDLDGRTPLHYAATLADNGHYYNLLLHLGANPLVQDNFGQKADFYKENQDDLSHKQLLRDFGAKESLADEMLVDKDINIFQDEQGHYLATSLGDPLLRGLSEVATNRPKDPVTYLALYLYNFANADKAKNNEQSNILILPENKEEEEEEAQIQENNDENDDGYPQSPDLDAPDTLFSETERDENGQSPLHFAANRSHLKDGLYHMLQETQINIAFRDSHYRTGRDVAEVSGNPENVQEIDKFVIYLAARGETDKLVELLLEGYDHILDAEDDGKGILQIAEEEDNKSTVEFLKSIKNYTDLRNEVHEAIRAGDGAKTRELLETNGDGARLLALGKNTTGRCSLHIAVLREHEDIVRYLAKNYPETLRTGDNLERTALHYAMGVHSVEQLSNILIQAGARRVQKDLKSRQPTYYFMNKTDIKEMQEEEESTKT